MVSLDQILLLEQKVESAVKKIEQLRMENDVLRNKCAELSNALSIKTEQLSAFEQDQNQIENGIKTAIERLNSIENAVLSASPALESEHPAASLEASKAAPEAQAEQASIVQAQMEQYQDAGMPPVEEIPQEHSPNGEAQDAPPQAYDIPCEPAPQNPESQDGQFDIF